MSRVRSTALSIALLSWAPEAYAQLAAGTRVLVVPFENVQSDARVDWLGEASAVLVGDGLRARGIAAVTRSERADAFEHLHLPMSGTLTRATVITVARLVGARDVVIGTFRVQGEELTVEAHSVRVDAGRLQPAITERGPLTELYGIYDRLARRISLDASAVPTAPAPPLAAFESYIKGLVAESPPTAAVFLESAIREFPAFDRARLALWEVRTEQGNHTAALAAASAVGDESPLTGRARFCAALSLLNLQRPDDSFTAFKALLDSGAGAGGAAGGTRGAHTRSQPPAGSPHADVGAIYNNLGVVQIRRGSPAQSGTATYYLTKATEADRDDPDYLFNLGYAYMLERNAEGSVYWLREVLRRDPTDADAHFVLAAALQASGSQVEAGRERELARQLSSRYEELERRAAADKLPVPRGLERVRSDSGSRALWPDRVILEEAHREQRELASFHLERGRRFFERENDTEAMSELRRAVFLSPYEAQAHLLIGRIHLRAGRAADAIDALKISVWSQETAAARTALAEALLKTGDRTAARREAERALALDPSSVNARRLLAELK
jgi:Tfp pilus assembly protein PilF/TolB-like protein